MGREFVGHGLSVGDLRVVNKEKQLVEITFLIYNTQFLKVWDELQSALERAEEERPKAEV